MQSELVSPSGLEGIHACLRESDGRGQSMVFLGCELSTPISASVFTFASYEDPMPSPAPSYNPHHIPMRPAVVFLLIKQVPEADRGE